VESRLVESEHLEAAEGKRMYMTQSLLENTGVYKVAERWIRGYKSIQDENFEKDGKLRRLRG
jgi:hypothetical protein